MKKVKRNMYYLILISLITLGTLALPSRAMAANTHIFIDDVKVIFNDALPKIINSRTMVPIRIVSENMGYDVDWSEATWNKGKQLVWISKGSTKVELEMNKSTALVNGIPVAIDKLDNGTIIDTKPYIENGRTFVPIRFISQAMGAKVDWEIKAGDLYVYVNRTNKQPPVDPTPTTPSKIEGNADQGTDKENFAKIRQFFGEYQYGEGTPTFKIPGGSSEGRFFWISNEVDAPYNVEVIIEAWYVPANDSIYKQMGSLEFYKLINPAVKEVLRFYLPNGGADELYKILDDGHNGRLGSNKDKYINKEFSSLIGADRPVSIISAQSGLQVLIGNKR